MLLSVCLSVSRGTKMRRQIGQIAHCACVIVAVRAGDACGLDFAWGLVVVVVMVVVMVDMTVPLMLLPEVG